MEGREGIEAGSGNGRRQEDGAGIQRWKESSGGGLNNGTSALFCRLFLLQALTPLRPSTRACPRLFGGPVPRRLPRRLPHPPLPLTSRAQTHRALAPACAGGTSAHYAQLPGWWRTAFAREMPS